MKAATPQSRITAARGRTGAAHLQRRTPAAPRCTAAPVRPMQSVADTPDAPETEADIHCDEREAGVPRVLLIDKDWDSAEALSALLMPEAHVIHAATLAEAQHLLRRDIFALVVIDPALPDDTRLWAALQDASGGAWGGSVFDVDTILNVLAAGRRALQR